MSADEALFLDAVSGAEPLVRSDGRAAPRKHTSGARPRVEPLPLPVVEREGDRISARADGVTNRQLTDLRAREIDPADTIDLHGLDVRSAERKLSEFVRARSTGNSRHLLVITGRGLHSENGPVLGEAAVRVLASAPVGQLVAGFCTAGPRQGDRGALCVLLRKM